MKAYREVEEHNHSFLTLALLVNRTPRPVYPRKRTTAPIEYEGEWAPEAVWTFSKKTKNRFSLPGSEALTIQSHCMMQYYEKSKCEHITNAYSNRGCKFPGFLDNTLHCMGVSG
jgi:hypothetical protein